MDEKANAAIETDELPCLPPGTIVGGYILHECVGRGAMAHIYRAEHCVLGREVALKILAPSLMADTAARNRLLREARVTATLKHPNIIDVSDARFHEGNPYVVLDLLCGEDLQSRLQRDGRLPHEETVELGLALASALAAAHGRGIVHRDIKPGNVFLARGSDGEIVPKLLDFGICRAPFTSSGADLSATPRDELMGSPLYLSPEGVLGATDLDARSDQYALGVMMYECVTGRPPYLEDTLYSLFQAIANGNIPAPSQFVRDIPPALEQVILRALSRDPGKRFASMQDLGASLLAAGNPRARVIWSLAFGVRDPELRSLSTTSPALSLDRTTKLTRPPRRKPLRTALAATVTAIPALYALAHVLDPDPYAARRAEPAHAAWPSVGAGISPFTPPGAVAAPPPRAALETAQPAPQRAPGETRPSTLGFEPAASALAVASPVSTPSVTLAPAPTPDVAPPATPPRPAKKAPALARPASNKPVGAAAELALVTTPPPSLGPAPARVTPAAASSLTRAQSAAVALGLGSTRPAASSAGNTVSQEQDEVRKLFFPPRPRAVAATGPAAKRAPASPERLAR
jgi:serine/threonine protein kinase